MGKIFDTLNHNLILFHDMIGNKIKQYLFQLKTHKKNYEHRNSQWSNYCVKNRPFGCSHE